MSAKIKEMNDKLKVICANDGYNFVENDQSFFLMNGSVNDSFLTNDGLHLTKRGVDSLLVNCQVIKEGSVFTPKRYPSDTNDDIVKFKGHKHPLSNFFPVIMHKEGKKFCSSEAAYQHTKAETMGAHGIARRIQQANTGFEAMRIASKIVTDKNWQQKKLDVMRDLLTEKLKVCDKAKTTLLDTGSKVIQEDTTHEFWGRGKSGHGSNMLGKLWMELRQKIRENPAFLNRALPDKNPRERIQTRNRQAPSNPPPLDNRYRRYQSDGQWATRNNQPKCYKCGETGHGIRQCRQKETVICWTCEMAGHKQKHCRENAYNYPQRTYYPPRYDY